MSNMLQDAAAWLGAKLQTAGGRAVVYRRGNKSVGITATPQMRSVNVDGEDGTVATAVELYAWTVTASELLFNGELFEPQERDTIDDTPNGTEIIWKVLPPADNKKCYEWLDSSGLLLTVHVKRDS